MRGSFFCGVFTLHKNTPYPMFVGNNCILFGNFRGMKEAPNIDDIKMGVSVFFEKIKLNEEDLHLSKKEALVIIFLRGYLEWLSETTIYNYVVSCAHRTQPEESEMENIRTMLTLCRALYYMSFLRCEDSPDEEHFYMPEGWKKQ